MFVVRHSLLGPGHSPRHSGSQEIRPLGEIWHVRGLGETPKQPSLVSVASILGWGVWKSPGMLEMEQPPEECILRESRRNWSLKDRGVLGGGNQREEVGGWGPLELPTWAFLPESGSQRPQASKKVLSLSNLDLWQPALCEQPSGTAVCCRGKQETGRRV